MAVETFHRVIVVSLELGLAEALKSTARWEPLVLDDEIKVSDGVASQLVAVSLTDRLTVDHGELTGNLG